MSVADVQYGTPACSLPKLTVKIASPPEETTATDNGDSSPTSIAYDQFPVWLVAFRRLMKGTLCDAAYTYDVHSRELLHSLAGLYSIILPNMDNDTLYASLLDKKAVTMIVFQERENALCDLLARLAVKEERRMRRKAKAEAAEANGPTEGKNKSNKKKDNKPVSESDSDEEDEEVDIEGILESGRFDVAEGAKDVYKTESLEESDFACVFTDSGSSDGDDDEDEDGEEGEGGTETDEDEEEQYSTGYNAYVKSCLQRKIQQRDNADRLDQNSLGVENLLVAGMTFETKFVDHVKILHLTLLCVRKRFRARGLGSQLMRTLKDASITGDYHAIVVHADSDAIGFFQRHGFTEDYVLNRRWSELADEYTDCTLMTYLAGFSRAVPVANTPGSLAFSLDLAVMEGEMEEWRRKEEEAHTSQVQLFFQMRQEILHLRASLASQNDIVKYLMKELRKSSAEKSALENEILTTKYDRIKAALSSPRPKSPPSLSSCLETLAKGSPGGGDGCCSSGVEGDASKILTTEDFDQLEKIGRDFEQALNSDPRCQGSTVRYTVTKVAPALLTPAARTEFQRVRAARPSLKMAPPTRLFFCGSQERPSRIQEIMSQGFTDHDMKQSSQGKALYFAAKPTTAALFSVTGKLILAEVSLGKVARAADDGGKKRGDRPQRAAPPEGFDSVLTAGRSRLTPISGAGSNDTGESGSLEEEYVVFTAGQALPLALIEYTVAS